MIAGRARAVLVAVITVALVAGACGTTTPTLDGAPGATGATGGAVVTPRATIVPIPGHEVYGYLPYWEMDDSIVDHVAATDLTTLALFSVTHRRDGELDDGQSGYRHITGAIGRQVVRTAQDRGARVELVYTSFGAGKNRQFYTEPGAQTRWIEVLVDLVEELGLDGVNVDVETLPREHVIDYGAFVGRLRAALRARLPRAQVSVATQANELGAAMAAAAGVAGADRIFLMGYDYHWAGSEPGASAPIDRLDGAEKDLVWSLDLYGALGVPVELTILGLPLYGMTWPVVGPGVGSPSVGRGDAWIPRRNLGVLGEASFAPSLEPVESVEFYAVPAGGSSSAPSGDPPGWTAVYYDSPRSLAPKLSLANERGLAGAGFWAIGYERGLPGYGELMATFRAGALEAP